MLGAYRTAPRSVICVLGAFVASMPVFGACTGEERACYPGDFVACTCEDEQPGYAECDPDGVAYGACTYCGTTPGLAQASGTTATAGGGGAGGASGDGGGGGGGGALLPFMSPCETDDACASGMCHAFPSKGPHCTQACDGPEDCPAPSPGCNPMGICKAP